MREVRFVPKRKAIIKNTAQRTETNLILAFIVFMPTSTAKTASDAKSPSKPALEFVRIMANKIREDETAKINLALFSL